MYDKAVSKDPFMLKYCLNGYKTQEMCDKAVNNFLPALKFVSDWFVTSKMIKNLHNALFTDDDILFLTKILAMSHFLLTILIILTLMMLILMKMILKLFMSDSWLGITDFHANHVRKI